MLFAKSTCFFTNFLQIGLKNTASKFKLDVIHMLRANAKWVDNYLIDVDNARGHSIKMDLPSSYEGDDTAATPLE